MQEEVWQRGHWNGETVVLTNCDESISSLHILQNIWPYEPTYQSLSKPRKGLAQVRDHATNLISLREHLCKVAQVNERDPAWRHRNLNGTVTKHV